MNVSSQFQRVSLIYNGFQKQRRFETLYCTECIVEFLYQVLQQSPIRKF